jgi:hypothetical protein
MFESDRNIKEKEESLADKLNYLENYYADTMLNDELKQVYAKIQLNCAEFRENIFFKNIAIIEYNLGQSLPKQDKTREESEREHMDKLKNVKSYEEMIKEYENKEII